ncbi:PspC domain-containing protein [Prochlorococcus sp. MIT 1223]|uniref:PspC domain-containing protein n=1 Tax=Prochlorococcus sp. MIT 1223 TaxID=3096217 RepID=UPI002A75F86A|nr:PspC domain-containing protein [Prochlorococcus sp. MIT 1223]
MKIFRLKKGALLAGVCSGLGGALGGNAYLWRIGFVIGTVIFPLSLVIYALLAIFLPIKSIKDDGGLVELSDIDLPEIDQSLARKERWEIIKKSGIPLGSGSDLYKGSITPSDSMLADWERLILLRGAQNDQVEYKSVSSTEYLQKYSGKTWGEILGELTGGATLLDGKQTWQIIDDKEAKQDLGKMLACCQAELAGMYATGNVPAPAYFERAAILFRKDKLYEKEIQVCEFYIDLITQYCEISKKLGCSKGIRNWDRAREGYVDKFRVRIDKSRVLLEKQSQKKLQPKTTNSKKKKLNQSKTQSSIEIITPPKNWQINLTSGELILDGDWQFILEAKSEKDYEIYIYEVKDFPRLLKIGIAKDSLKRKESYYGELLWRKTMIRRNATLVEYLFMHATYHLAHKSPPKWNVGNFQEDNALEELTDFYSKVGMQAKGITEVRKISLDAAISTIENIENQLTSKFLRDVIQNFAISTWLEGGRSTVSVTKDQKW